MTGLSVLAVKKEGRTRAKKETGMEDLGQILGVVLEPEESDRLRLRLEALRQAGAALGYLIADEVEPLTIASLEDE